jgi:hypothetical protein
VTGDALPPAARRDLLAAVRLARPWAGADRGALAALLYAGWFARALGAGGGGGGGWWTTSAAGRGDPAAGLVRVYWNCPAGAAGAVVAGIAGALGGVGASYALKCPAAPAGFARADAVVLYLGADLWPAARGPLREAHRALAGRLRDPVPPLTLRLGRGAAAAEDPGDGSSFGESRSRAVADGLAAAAAAGLREERDVLEAVVAALRAHGISVARPHQRAGSPPGLVTPW